MTGANPHPCQLIWQLAGRPDPAATVPEQPGQCALCATVGPTVGQVGPNFTDYRELAVIGSGRLCPACTWALGGKPPRTLRMWTIVARLDQPCPPSQPAAYVHGEHLHLTNRKDMLWPVRTLLNPPEKGPWLVAVAESGQKHVAPFTPVNNGPGPWQARMDSTVISSSPDELRMILTHVTALLAEKIGRDAIETGRPPMSQLKTPAQLAAWREHHPPLRPYTGSPLLHLACHLPTKTTLDQIRSLL